MSPLASSLSSSNKPATGRSPTLTCPTLPSNAVALHSIRPFSSCPYSSFTKPLSPSTTKNPPKAAYQPSIHVYPDPIPEFAQAETKKFRGELMKKLSKEKDTFGNDIDAVVKVCEEIFSEFMHKEYGGPGTLLVEPFTDMLLALKEKKLPGAPVAARAALLWAQNHVDRDWETWTQ